MSQREFYTVNATYGETVAPLTVVPVRNWRDLSLNGSHDTSEGAASLFNDKKAFDVYANFSFDEDRRCEAQFSFSPMVPAYFTHLWPRRRQRFDLEATIPLPIDYRITGGEDRPTEVVNLIFMMGLYNLKISSHFRGRRLGRDYGRAGVNLELLFGDRAYEVQIGGTFDDSVTEPRLISDSSKLVLTRRGEKVSSLPDYFILPHTEEARGFTVTINVVKERKPLRRVHAG